MNSREIRTRLRDAGFPTAIVDIFTSYEADLAKLKQDNIEMAQYMFMMMKLVKVVAESMHITTGLLDPLLSKTDKMQKERKANEIIYSEPIDVVGDPKNNE